MKVTIYSKSGCPYCMMAKTWFDNNHIKYQEIVLNNNQQKTKYGKNQLAQVEWLTTAKRHIIG